MFREITSVKKYSINVLNAQRLMLMHNGERLCKYDNTKEGIHDLVEDFVEMLIDEKQVRPSDRRWLKNETMEKIANFAF